MGLDFIDSLELFVLFSFFLCRLNRKAMHDYRGINRISTLEREAKSARTINSSRKSQDSDESPKVIHRIVRPDGQFVSLPLTHHFIVYSGY